MCWVLSGGNGGWFVPMVRGSSAPCARAAPPAAYLIYYVDIVSYRGNVTKITFWKYQANPKASKASRASNKPLYVRATRSDTLSHSEVSTRLNCLVLAGIKGFSVTQGITFWGWKCDFSTLELIPRVTKRGGLELPLPPCRKNSCYYIQEKEEATSSLEGHDAAKARRVKYKRTPQLSAAVIPAAAAPI